MALFLNNKVLINKRDVSFLDKKLSPYVYPWNLIVKVLFQKNAHLFVVTVGECKQGKSANISIKYIVIKIDTVNSDIIVCIYYCDFVNIQFKCDFNYYDFGKNPA